MTDTQITISSFAAPTDADIAVWDNLSFEEKRSIARRELLTPATTEPRPITTELRYTLFAQAIAEL